MSKENKPFIDQALRDKLRAPFPLEAYGKADKSFLTSIKAQYIIERLNDCFGVGRWTCKHEVIACENKQVLMKGTLIIFDYDCCIPDQYGSHKTEGTGVVLADGYKSAVTDIITKSASYIEIGLDVFKGLVNPDGTYKNAELDPNNETEAEKNYKKQLKYFNNQFSKYLKHDTLTARKDELIKEYKENKKNPDWLAFDTAYAMAYDKITEDSHHVTINNDAISTRN